jgi:hypothetical protein
MTGAGLSLRAKPSADHPLTQQLLTENDIGPLLAPI